ncbi:MAG: RNA polymerase-binding protein DksA [Proteobacteria bacterium]|nr:RNA polymerase-binding protein DksA [Pseudomonadota bacterium]
MQKTNNNYDPSKDSVYMSDEMLTYFKEQLTQWRNKLKHEAHSTITKLKDSAFMPDPADQASLEYGQIIDLRTHDRERKLISKIDEAIDRVEKGTFGYCSETDEPIGVKRLMARPIATLCIEAKQAQEREEREYAK